MSSILFASGSLAKEETRNIKVLGTVLSAQPSIQSKTLIKLSMVLKCLPWRQKISGIKLKQKKISVGFYEVRLQIFHLKSKNRFWVKKYAFPLIHQLDQPSSNRFFKGCAVWVDGHLWYKFGLHLLLLILLSHLRRYLHFRLRQSLVVLRKHHNKKHGA